MSLRRRLVLTLFVLGVIGFLAAARWIRGEFRNSYAQVIEETMSDYAHIISANAENHKMSKEGFANFKNTFDKYQKHEFNSKIFNFVKTKPTLGFYITDANGIVVFSTAENEIGKDYSKWNDVYRTLRGEYGARSTRLDKNDSRTSVYFVAAPIIIDSKIAGVASVYKTESSVLPFLDNALEKMFMGGLFTVVVVAIFGALIMIWITLPLERLRAYALEISEGKRAVLPKTNIKEIRHLSDAFEKMRISLEGKKTVEKYTQTLTHELKSPLTAIKGAAELSLEDMPQEQRKQFLNNIIDEANRSHSILEQLLKIAALESRSGLEQAVNVDPVEVLNEAKGALISLWRMKDITVDIKFENQVTISCDRFLLFQAFRNIIQNAIEFSPAKSKIEIKLEQDSKNIKISFKDEGSGIPDYAKDRIFEKFYSLERPDSKKKSSGLGLSFVKEVVELHNGEIHVESPVFDGKGTQLTLVFPKI